MSELRAVIFDVDGTLVDSERDGHRVAFNAAFEGAGLPDRWDVPTYGRLLTITGGAKRMAHWFESTGRSAEEASELAKRLHTSKTRIMRRLVEEGRVGAFRLLADLSATSPGHRSSPPVSTIRRSSRGSGMGSRSTEHFISVRGDGVKLPRS